MDVRRSYFRRSVKRARLQKRVAVTAVVAAAACAAYLLHAEAPHKDKPSTASVAPVPAAREVLRVADQAAPAAVRRVYPYSIVPGGVGSRAELARAVMADKVVAAHYAGFAVEKASLRTVDRARAVYVSYRKGEQVYWTAHKVRLAEGETVLSDGQNDIRGRCGNRISDTPQLPVEAKGPGEQELDTPSEQGEDGALRQVSADLDEQDGGEPFVLRSFPNGAGLLAAAQAHAGASQAGPGALDTARANLGILPSSTSRARTLLASLDKPASDGATHGATDGGAPGTAGEPASGSGGVTTGDTGSGGGTPADGPGGATGTTTGGGDKPGGTPDGGDPGTPPAPGMPPDPLPVLTPPAKPHELPEPGSLWLTGLATAALLLQRRLRARCKR